MVKMKEDIAQNLDFQKLGKRKRKQTDLDLTDFETSKSIWNRN
ncbi:12297_t:CDS:2 [Funneliformis geosporum]|uniref:12297_t:CDS:1 n=1 Tax=Funneliformis geosporum TaxID=1117311 RepID=A0A9W4WP36_9GLOM|nr:12297_t:CDS:2 [Funneliformis geosporum]